jgi:hypothetical protein
VRILVEYASTLFIKLNKYTKKPEKAWLRKCHGFRNVLGLVYFKVNLEKEISISKTRREYLYLGVGWHLIISEKSLRIFKRLGNFYIKTYDVLGRVVLNPILLIISRNNIKKFV